MVIYDINKERLSFSDGTEEAQVEWDFIPHILDISSPGKIISGKTCFYNKVSNKNIQNENQQRYDLSDLIVHKICRNFRGVGTVSHKHKTIYIRRTFLSNPEIQKKRFRGVYSVKVSPWVPAIVD